MLDVEYVNLGLKDIYGDSDVKIFVFGLLLLKCFLNVGKWENDLVIFFVKFGIDEKWFLCWKRDGILKNLLCWSMIFK